MIGKILSFPVKILLGIILPIWIIGVSVSNNLLDEDFYIGMFNKTDILLEVVKKEALKFDVDKREISEKILAAQHEIMDISNELDQELSFKEKNLTLKRLKSRKKSQRELNKELSIIIRKEKKFLSKLKYDLNTIMPEVDQLIKDKIVDTQLKDHMISFVEYLKGKSEEMPDIIIDFEKNGFKRDIYSIAEEAVYQGDVKEKTANLIKTGLKILPESYEPNRKKLIKEIEPVKKYFDQFYSKRFLYYALPVILLLLLLSLSRKVITTLFALSFVLRVASYLFPVFLIVTIAPEPVIKWFVSFFPAAYVKYLEVAGNLPETVVSNGYSYLRQIFFMKWTLIFISFYAVGKIMKIILKRRTEKADQTEILTEPESSPAADTAE